MRVSFLEHLACPAARGGERCLGPLAVRSGEIPARFAADDPDELHEGVVGCARCAAWCPVLGGVLILVRSPLRYLASHFAGFISTASLQGELSPEVLGWLAEKHLHQHEGRPVRDDSDSSPALHYGRPAELLAKTPVPESFRAFLEEWDGQSPYDVLAEMAVRHADGAGRGRRLAVDAGCGVGGLVDRLAERFDVAVGADISYSSVLTARSILLGRPRPYQPWMHVERDDFHPLPWTHGPRRNVELVVADCVALPFRGESADAVASANVIEMIPPRASLQEAARVIRPDGLLLFTDPFSFRVGRFPSAQSHLPAVQEHLQGLGLRTLEERDFVPWIWYIYQRHIQIYFNYCAAFRKPGPGAIDGSRE